MNKVFALIAFSAALASCGGEDGDSSDPVARGEINKIQKQIRSINESMAGIESDFGLLSVDVGSNSSSIVSLSEAIDEINDELSDLSAKVQALESNSSVMFYDQAMNPVARVVGAEGGLWNNDYDVLGITPKGFLFLFSPSKQTIDGQRVFFEGMDCSGQAFVDNVSPANAGYYQGIVFNVGDENGPGIFYMSPKEVLTIISPVSTWNVQQSICENGSWTEREARAVYRDATGSVTGLPGYLPGPLIIK